MKLRTITLFFFLVSISSMAMAQVTLTTESNTPPAGYIDTLIFGLSEGMDSPAEGAALFWDYSAMLEDSVLTLEVFDVSGNTYLSPAYFVKEGNLRFQAFRAPTSFYFATDEQGVYSVGRVVTETSLPLTAVTGNPDDTFVFISDTVAFEGRVNEISFPMTYQDTFGGTQIERTNISLSVAAFGLVNAPILNLRYHSETNTVVGYGQVIIPMEDRSPSPPIDVLLVRKEIVAVDSFFLGGALAPPALTAAFGVSQGIESTEQFYEFYTPGLIEPVLRFSYDAIGGALLPGTVYRPVAAGLVSSSTRALSPVQVSMSPNPVRRGDVLRIQTDQQIATRSLHLLNQQGQLVSMPSARQFGDQYEVTIPAQLPPGLYFLQAYDEQNRRIQAQKIIIQ